MNASDLAKILDELGQRLGPTGQHVFELAVRQQLIVGWILLVVTLVMGAATVVGLSGAIVQSRRRPNDPKAGDDAIAAFATFGMIFVACIVLFLLFGLDKLLNPEYAAIKDILGAIKP